MKIDFDLFKLDSITDYALRTVDEQLECLNFEIDEMIKDGKTKTKFYKKALRDHKNLLAERKELVAG